MTNDAYRSDRDAARARIAELEARLLTLGDRAVARDVANPALVPTRRARGSFGPLMRLGAALAVTAVAAKTGVGRDMRNLFLVFLVALLVIGSLTSSPRDEEESEAGKDAKRAALLRSVTTDPEAERDRLERESIERELSELRSHLGDDERAVEAEREEEDEEAAAEAERTPGAK